MPVLNRFGALGAAGPALLGPGQTGCTLESYDQSRSDAVKATQAFEKIAKKSFERYEAMLANLKRIGAEADALISDLVANASVAELTLSPTQPIGSSSQASSMQSAKSKRSRPSIATRPPEHWIFQRLGGIATRAGAAAVKDARAKVVAAPWNASLYVCQHTKSQIFIGYMIKDLEKTKCERTDPQEFNMPPPCPRIRLHGRAHLFRTQGIS